MAIASWFLTGRSWTTRGRRIPDSLDNSNALRYIGEVNPEIKAAAWVRDLASRGTYHFTTAEAEAALGVSGVAARASLRRLKSKQLIASPFRGFQVILPPEYRHIGCLPAEDFVPQLLDRLGVPYYFGLLSAAAFYGAAHQQPQVAQVVVPKNRLAIECGRVKVEFIARGNLVEIPARAFNTPRGRVLVSSPEATAFDLVGRPERCGGLDHVATLLAELAETLDARKLVELFPLSPVPWSQRLGFLLDLLGHRHLAEALAIQVAAAVHEVALLVPQGRAQGTRNQRWRMLINAEIEPDL